MNELHDGKASVKANKVGQEKGSHWHVASKLHACVYILLGAQTLKVFQKKKKAQRCISKTQGNKQTNKQTYILKRLNGFIDIGHQESDTLSVAGC